MPELSREEIIPKIRNSARFEIHHNDRDITMSILVPDRAIVINNGDVFINEAGNDEAPIWEYLINDDFDKDNIFDQMMLEAAECANREHHAYWGEWDDEIDRRIELKFKKAEIDPFSFIDIRIKVQYYWEFN